MATLRDIIDTFTEQDLDTSVPIALQDVSETDYVTVNTYNNYIKNGDYSTAISYRNVHPELEKYILDVKKYNILQAFIINAYLYAKSQKQQCQISTNTPEGQIEGDIWFKVNEDIIDEDYTYCKSYYLDKDGAYKEFSLLSSSMFEEITQAEIDAICG